MFTFPASHFGKDEKLNKANFPCLIEAFIDTGISGNDLVGTLGTVTIASSTGWTQPASGQFRRNTSGTVTSSGSWEAIGNRHALLIAIGSFSIAASNLLRLGAVPGTGSQIALNNTSTGNSSGPSTGNSVAFTGTSLVDDIKGMAIKIDQTSANGHGYQYFYDGTSEEGPIVETVLNGDISTNWPAFNIGAACAAFTTNTSSYYTGIFLLAFNTFPDDIDIAAALVWMSAHEKKLFPGFYKRS